MTLTSKIHIDRFIGLPLVYLIDHIARMVLVFKHQTMPDNSAIRRIAVCKFMGMGSIIEATPLLQTLRMAYPQAEILFITSPAQRALIDTFPFVDTVETIDDRSLPALLSSVIRLLVRRWRKRSDVFIDLEVHSSFSTIIAALCMPACAIGFARHADDQYPGIYSAAIQFDTGTPVHELYLRAARSLGCSSFTTARYNWNNFVGTPGNTDRVWRQTGISLPPSRYLVINANASDLRIERRWDRTRYSELIDRLLDEYPDLTVVLTGSVDERAYVGTIREAVARLHFDRIIDTSGRLSLEELITLINGCALMVTNDSGPMHIALALRKATVALFGPCSPDAFDSEPTLSIVYRPVVCSPCVHDFAISPCHGDNQCMKRISTELVMQAVRRALYPSVGNPARIHVPPAADETSFGYAVR